MTRPDDQNLQPFPPSILLLEALWLLWQSIAADGETQLHAELGLDLRAFIALSHLQARSFQPAELANALMLRRYETSRLLAQLEEKKLIQRVPGLNADGRRVTVSITPDGRALWQKGIGVASRVTEGHLSNLSDTDIISLIQTLRRIPQGAKP